MSHTTEKQLDYSIVIWHQIESESTNLITKLENTIFLVQENKGDVSTETVKYFAPKNFTETPFVGL